MPLQVINTIMNVQAITSVTDLTRYPSTVVDVEQLREKEITVYIDQGVRKVNAGGLGALGALWVWVSVSNDGVNYQALGGQSSPQVYDAGFNPAVSTTMTPLNPNIIVPISVLGGNPTGTYRRQDRLVIPWSIHSKYARLDVQQPVAGTTALATWIQFYWNITAIFAGRS